MPRSPWRGTAPTAGGRTRGRCRCTPTWSRPAPGGTSSTRSPPTGWGPSCCTTATRSTRSCASGPGADDLWLRRSAILSQLTFKEQTDTQLLADCIEPNLEDTSFWIRKAIGWALRQHARTDPGWVRQAVAGYGDRLSGLSRREALKHL